MKNLKIMALVLCLLMVFPLVACGGGETTTPTGGGNVTPVTKDAGDPNEKYDAEIKDLKGHEFLFLVYDTTYSHLYSNEVYAEALNGDKVNDAVFKRNSQLQTTYNCTISEERSSDPLGTVKEPLIAGEYVYDLLYIRNGTLRSLASSGLLVDLNTLSNINLDKVWWDQNIRAGMTLNGHTFYATGDAGTMDDRCTWVFWFNRDLIEKNYLENPYDLVRQGTWTVSKCYEMGEACWSDEDGDGIFQPNNKDVAAYEIPGQANWALMCGFGMKGICDVSESGEIYIPGALSRETLDTWAEVKDFMTNPHRDVCDSGTRFRNGKCAFYMMNLGSILNYENSAMNFGILPVPKRNAEQTEYWTAMDYGWCSAYAIPITVDNMEGYKECGFESGSEMCAYFLEAFAYNSKLTLTEAFFEQVVKRQMIRDEDSIEMMALALKNKNFDPCAVFAWGNLYTIFRDCGSPYRSGTGGNATNAVGSADAYDTLVSSYEARLEAARKALRNYLKNLDPEEEPAT